MWFSLGYQSLLAVTAKDGPQFSGENAVICGGNLCWNPDVSGFSTVCLPQSLPCYCATQNFDTMSGFDPTTLTYHTPTYFPGQRIRQFLFWKLLVAF